MHKLGHYGVNAILYAPISIVLSLLVGLEAAAFGALIVILSASVPDIDIRLPFISHRGITHTIWFAVIVGVMFGSVTTIIPVQTINTPVLFTLGFVFGFVSVSGHLVADALTPMGVKPFNPPRETKYTYSWFNSDSKLANAGLAILGLIVISVAWSVTLVVMDVQQLPVLPQTLPNPAFIEVMLYG